MEIKNYTGNYEEVIKFFSEKMKPYKTDNLKVMVKEMTGSGIVAGMCTYPTKPARTKRGWRLVRNGMYKISARVNSRKTYPVKYEMPVGSRQFDDGTGWSYILDTDVFNNKEESMVWVLGHEVWHYLCKTKQEKGNFQTKSNKNGYVWLREFKKL